MVSALHKAGGRFVSEPSRRHEKNIGRSLEFPSERAGLSLRLVRRTQARDKMSRQPASFVMNRKKVSWSLIQFSMGFFSFL